MVEALARGVGPQGTAAAYLLDTAEALRARGCRTRGWRGRSARGWPASQPRADLGPHRCSAWTISCVTFLASPKSIMVFGRKNSSLSTPA